MLVILLSGIAFIASFIYWVGAYNERYWKKRRVAFYKKNKVLGVFWNYLTDDRSLFEHFYDIYKQYPDEPAVGIGSFLTPALYVKDPINIQHVLATNFSAFNHRGFEPNEEDLLANNILFLNGKKWQLMRQSMSPLFTSSKLKNMFYIIDKSAQDFVKFLKNNPNLAKGDTFNILSTFCSAAICAAVFGVTTESIFDSPFLKVAQKALRPTFKRNIQFTIGSISLRLTKLLNIKLFKEFEPFFIGAIKQTLRQREKENTKKHDFADICVQLQKKGILRDPETGLELEPTDELLAAQGFFFFLAGVEPTASAMFSTLLELGRHPEILKSLHEEIDELFEKCDGKLSFEAIVDKNYLDMAIFEAMRLHPSIGFLSRMCTEDTILPNGNIKVDKGTKIFTPIFELHHDPKYFPEPEVFNPKRFSKESSNKVTDVTYQPFGKGNRICVGMRYAQLQVKTGLIYLLRNFTVRTIVYKGGIKYEKNQVQVRLTNVDVKFLPRI
ncbi:cytochrome P450 6B5-like [Melitaea cinxia]|uniref:cytochrome P450 6B5-like n=1 Tax=Melitaea cinxia TaxID=113334 RepID=UPI001E2713BC|nr:cytochrome P450 6B5-like [Melitaea cinxia]